jgi:hypothetical protein
MRRDSPIDELLTIFFMILAVGAIISYFAVSSFPLYLLLGGVAVVLRIVQYIMRFL